MPISNIVCACVCVCMCVCVCVRVCICVCISVYLCVYLYRFTQSVQDLHVNPLTMALSNTCQIAFHGVLLPSSEDLEYQKSFLPQLKVYKLKTKEGVVERVRFQ